MAPLRCAAKFDPFLSLDCAPALHPGAIQGKEGIKFCYLATMERDRERVSAVDEVVTVNRNAEEGQLGGLLHNIITTKRSKRLIKLSCFMPFAGQKGCLVQFSYSVVWHSCRMYRTQLKNEE